MIRAVTITNYLGESIRIDLFNPEESGYIVRSITGLGSGKADINISEVATDDGGIYNSSRAQSRSITISLTFYMCKDSIETLRQRTYKYFPKKKPLKLLIETDNRMAEIVGYVEENEPSIFSKNEGSDIVIKCPSPYFYSAGDDKKNITVFSEIEPLFEFPFENNSLTEDLIEMGEIKNKAENVVVYNGDIETGVIITIHALDEVGDITIYNIRTREVMSISAEKISKITGKGIIAGDDIIINTIKRNKGITLLRNGEYTNILNCLNKNADWFQLKKGDNIFAYTAKFGSSSLQFKIENRLLYEGI